MMVLIWQGKGQQAWDCLGRVGTDGWRELLHRLADLKRGSNESVAVAKPGLGSSTQTLIPRVREVRRAQRPPFPDEEEKVSFFFCPRRPRLEQNRGEVST